MVTKSEQLQIRLTSEEKARLKRLARRAGLDVSGYVLHMALGVEVRELRDILGALRRDEKRSYALAALSDLLTRSTNGEFVTLSDDVDVRELPVFTQNYVAAMVEQQCVRRSVEAPTWLSLVQPLTEPWFATPLPGLRAHLLRQSPVAFRRRNIFVDRSTRV